MLICPECHSTNTIWDYKNGYIVCANCGLVLDRIYIEHIDKNIINDNKLSNRVLISNMFDERKKRHEYHKKSSRLKKIMKLLNEVKLRPYLTLDTEAVNEYLLGKRSHVKLFRYKTWTPKSDLVLKQIIEKVINKDPILASRTDRAKWAIARILVQLSIDKKIDMKRIANETKLSITHVRRLVSVVEKRRDHIELVRRILR